MGQKRLYDNYDYDEAYEKELQKEITRRARKEFERLNPLKTDDYEESWKTAQHDREEYEYERLLREGKVECLYRTSTYKSTNEKSGNTVLEAMVYPAYKNSSDMPRTNRGRESRPSQRNLNDKNARRHLARILNINFGEGDLWATFGWNKENLPPDMETAEREVVNFIRRINRRRKKLGGENARYVYVLAYDNYTRPHVHMVISGDLIGRDELEKIWGRDERPNTRRIKPDEMILTGLANYIARNPHGSKRWRSSKNLTKPPKPTRSYSKFSRRKVNSMARDHEILREMMEKAYKGYTFRDAEVKFNSVTAAFYIYARMTRN